MKMLETWLAEPLVAALGWALLHFIWQGTLVAFMLAGLLRVVRQWSTNARYAAACAALLLMAALPLATMLLSIPGGRKSDLRPRFATEAALPPLAVGIEPSITTTQTNSATDSPRRWPSIRSESLAPLLPWTILLWLLGVAFFSLRLAGGWFYIRRLRSRGARPMEEAWQQSLQRLCDELRVARPVRLLESTLIGIPTAIGWLRPAILLPVGALAGLSPQQLEAIIAHELAHIRRHDYLINLLQAVIETLLFYHPAVWWVSRQIRLEREHCCDDLAVAVCGDPLAYARALLEMEQLRAAELQLAVAANGGLLMNRIERLVGVRRQPANRFAGLLACLIVLTTVVSIGAGAQILLPDSNQSNASSSQDDRAAGALLPALQDSSWNMRKAAVELLARLNGSRAMELLIAALRDQHPQVREQAVIGLGKIGDRRALEPLNQASQDKDEQIRKKAIEALGLLKQNDGESQTGALGKLLMEQSAGLLDSKTNQLAIASLLDARIPVREDLPAQEQITHRYQLSPSARVEVSYILGSVEIEGIDGDSAEVHIVRSANTQADLERFDRIHIEHTPARLVLRGEDSKSNGIEIRHRVRMRLPRNARLDLREINGRVHINGMEGAIRLNEVNGGAQIPQLSGELEMSSVNGRIMLGLARLVPNGITLHDVGTVELQVSDGVNAELEIGDLDAPPLLETPRASLQQRGEKKFQVRIGAGGPVIRIIDVNGQVKVRSS